MNHLIRYHYGQADPAALEMLNKGSIVNFVAQPEIGEKAGKITRKKFFSIGFAS